MNQTKSCLRASFAAVASLFAAIFLAAGCGHFSEIQVTSLELGPTDRYEVDLLEVHDEKMLAELMVIRNGEWFQEKRKTYLELNGANKFFRAHPFIYQQGKPIRFTSRKKCHSIVVFYRSNGLVMDATKPEQFPSNRKVLISLEKRRAVQLITPQR